MLGEERSSFSRILNLLLTDSLIYFIFSSVMFWSNDHDVLLCREVVNLNPFTAKKGSTQRSGMWEKIAEVLNECTVHKFRVDKRSVRDHVGILVNKHKRKVRAEEKASGIAPDEPTELDNLLDTIIALEESADAQSQEASAEKSEKIESDRAKAEDARLKAMEKLSETRKRRSSSESEDEKPKRQRRSGSDAMEFLAERAKMNYELKQEELKMFKEQQGLEREKMEAMTRQQQQTQQQQTEMLQAMQHQRQQSKQQLLNTQMMMMQQQQEQSRAMMALLEKFINK